MGGVRQVAAETLGVDTDDVIIEVQDTLSGSVGLGIARKPNVVERRRAAQFACQDLRLKILTLAEKLLETDREGLELAEDTSSTRTGPRIGSRCRNWPSGRRKASLRSRAESKPDPATYDDVPPDVLPVSRLPPSQLPLPRRRSRGRPGTGMVRVLRYAAAHDIGRADQPDADRGPDRGRRDAGDRHGPDGGSCSTTTKGFRTNTNWTDYKLPTLADLPGDPGHHRRTPDRRSGRTATRDSANRRCCIRRRRWPMPSPRQRACASVRSRSRRRRSPWRCRATPRPAASALSAPITPEGIRWPACITSKSSRPKGDQRQLEDFLRHRMPPVLACARLRGQGVLAAVQPGRRPDLALHRHGSSLRLRSLAVHGHRRRPREGVDEATRKHDRRAPRQRHPRRGEHGRRLADA